MFSDKHLERYHETLYKLERLNAQWPEFKGWGSGAGRKVEGRNEKLEWESGKP